MVVKSLVSRNSSAPPVSPKFAKTMNWPDGHQNRWLNGLRSNFLSNVGAWPGMVEVGLQLDFMVTIFCHD